MESQAHQKNFFSKKWVAGILLFFLLILLSGGAYYLWQGTPRYSLYQMAKAIKNNDPQTFLRYIDVDRVAEGLIDATIEEISSKFSPDASSEKSSKKESSHQSKELKKFMSHLVQASKPFIEQQIIRGIDGVEKERIFPLAFAFLSEVRREGDKAQVTVRVSAEETYQFVMERVPERRWRVVQFDFDFFKELQKARDKND